MNSKSDLKYLKLLSNNFPNIQSVCTEIINLKAILNLPKGTEHFLSDLHGEYESFLHILKNASGVIKTKIDELFENTMTSEERKKFATLVYYPEEKLELLKKDINSKEKLNEFYKITLYRLIILCKLTTSKYTRSKVRKAIPSNYSYILDELLHAEQDSEDKKLYYNQIIESIIKLDRADEFIIVISHLIQRLSIDHLHLIGDIYDRGPGPDIIIEQLMNYHSLDIQWGNHDIIWMGAASGNPACIFNVIRICARYDNLDILENSYGINIRNLIEFSNNTYSNDKCELFIPTKQENIETGFSSELLSKIQKASAIIQFKLEGQLIKKHPEYEMEDRNLLHKINYKTGEIEYNNKIYKLLDTNFPTINPKNPYELTQEENELVQKLIKFFTTSEKLQKHINFLYEKGSIYKIANNNLLMHGCFPVDENGNFIKFKFDKKEFSGKYYFDKIDEVIRKAFYTKPESSLKETYSDFLWYLWCGKNSPLFGKDSMKTFERYFIEDKNTWVENKNTFYSLTNNEEFCSKILNEFGINDSNGHIICGHVPVKSKSGESPIKANGKLLMIDGGLSKAYQKTTGIAGYTLIYNSYGLILTAHEAFKSTEDAIINELDIHSTKQIIEKVERKKVYDTDKGKELLSEISDLEKLLEAYRNGEIIN